MIISVKQDRPSLRLAVIPARGGSKRIPRKNIRPFAGRPMMAWTLEAAMASGCFDQVVVSTDDDAIANLAMALGAEVPFMREAHLADDYAGTLPVIADAIERLEAEGSHFSSVCCLYATAPFLRPSDIQAGMQQLETEANLDYVFAATPYRYPIQRALRMEDGRVTMWQPEYFTARSQDLIPAFHDAGQFYWGRVEAWREQRMIFSSRSSVVMLPGWRVQDIDDEDDWRRAEYLFAAIRASSQASE